MNFTNCINCIFCVILEQYWGVQENLWFPLQKNELGNDNWPKAPLKPFIIGFHGNKDVHELSDK